MNKLIHFCLHQKLVVLILLAFVIGWGIRVAPFDWDTGNYPRDPVAVDAIPDLGDNQQIVFTDWPGRSPQDIDDLEIIAQGTALQGGDRPQRWAATVYPGPKGNFVFNASTIWWCQGLSSPPGHQLPWSHWSRPHGPDSRVQRMTMNLLDRALS